MRSIVLITLALVLAAPVYAKAEGRVISSEGVQVIAPTGWSRVKPADPGNITDPQTVLVAGTRGVRPSDSGCQLTKYHVPPTGAVVVIVQWKTRTSGGGSLTPGRAPLKRLTRVRWKIFECTSGRGAVAQLALGDHAYQVNVLVGDRASRPRVQAALAVARSFDLRP